MNLTTLQDQQYEKCVKTGTNLKEMINLQSNNLNPLEELDFISKMTIGINILINEGNIFLSLI
jgi:hypothetical protein